ncbi:LacI family DNA-binding transcriptional regulator [Elusimicrobiota bacterium]
MNKIGLIIPLETYFFSQWRHNYYFTELLRGTIAAASLFEWNILIYHRNVENAGDYVSFCAQEKVKGVVILAPLFKEEDIKQVKLIEVPVITVNSRYPEISFVDADNARGAFEAVNYLIELGHKKIAVINGKISSTNGQHRFSGYKKAMSENGIKTEDRLIRYGDYSEDSGYFEMSDIISECSEEGGLPTAVFCANDLIAMGAMRAANEKGIKVPEELSVIGFDDLIISGYLNPPLTTVRQQLFHLGKEAVITLIGIIHEEKEAYQEVEVETRLIKRASVAAPKK